MVVMKTILDSFSRCLGSTAYDDPNQPSPPNSARGNGSSESNPASLPLNPIDAEATGRDPDQRNNQIHCCSVPLEYRGAFRTSEQEREDGNFLAHARKKASAVRRHRKITSSSSSISHKASLEKARKKSNKRKLDIFRKPQEPNSSFSKLLENNSAIPQMLCFANPIFDSADDDLKLFRDDYTVDEETIASTLYFDARYEHVVEKKEPMPLYQEFSVPLGEGDNNILQIYNKGSHQSIKDVYCDPNLPPPPPPTSSNANKCTKVNVGVFDTSMMDDTSSNESGSSPSSFGEQDLVEVAASPPQPIPAGCMDMPSPPPMCNKSRYELGVIESLDLYDGDDMPGLKLMSKSSNSTALTYVCSSKSNVSLSPGHGVRYKAHPSDQTNGEDEEGQHEGWVRVNGNTENIHVPTISENRS